MFYRKLFLFVGLVLSFVLVFNVLCLILVFASDCCYSCCCCPRTPQEKKNSKLRKKKKKLVFQRYFISLFSLSHSFTFLLFLYLLWLFVVVVVVLVVVLLLCCFVLLRAHQPKKAQQKNKTKPCFIVFFALFCLEAFGQSKANRPRANK